MDAVLKVVIRAVSGAFVRASLSSVALLAGTNGGSFQIEFCVVSVMLGR